METLLTTFHHLCPHTVVVGDAATTSAYTQSPLRKKVQIVLSFISPSQKIHFTSCLQSIDEPPSFTIHLLGGHIISSTTYDFSWSSLPLVGEGGRMKDEG